MKTWIHIAIVVIALVAAAAFFWEWHAARLDAARLQSQLAQAQQTIQQATNNQQQRDKQLTDTLSRLDDLKATVQSQQQILAKLPEILALPKPLSPAPQTAIGPDRSQLNSAPDSTKPADAILPSEDLKPLYDFAVDCKACQTKLATATADLTDEKTKTATLGRERDAALNLAKGGSLRQRVTRALKWFAIGAAAGAIAAKAR